MVKTRTEITKEAIKSITNEKKKNIKTNWISVIIIFVVGVIFNIFYYENNYIIIIDVLAIICIISIILSNLVLHKRIRKELDPIGDEVFFDYIFSDTHIQVKTVINKLNRTFKFEYKKIFNYVEKNDLLLIRGLDGNLFYLDKSSLSDEEYNYIINNVKGGVRNARK